MLEGRNENNKIKDFEPSFSGREKMKINKSLIFLILGILLLIASYFSFNYVTEYKNCGRCLEDTWLHGINLPYRISTLCNLACVSGEYPTDLYLYLFYLALASFVLAIVFFVIEMKGGKNGQ